LRLAGITGDTKPHLQQIFAVAPAAALAVCLIYALFFTLVPHAVAEPAKPAKIVSINLCADQLVLALAEKERIVSLSHLAADRELSQAAGSVGAIPLNGGRAEEIIAFEPDLIVAGRYAAKAAISVLRKLGYRVLELDIARSFQDIRDQILELGAALGEEEKARSLVKDMDGRLDRLASTHPNAPDVSRPSALFLQPNSHVAGSGSLVDAVMAEAGLVNAAAQNGIRGFGMLPMEKLILARPDILILDEQANKSTGLSYQMLNHPALNVLKRHATGITMPNRLWVCGTPATVEAAERLTALQRSMTNTSPRKRKQ